MAKTSKIRRSGLSALLLGTAMVIAPVAASAAFAPAAFAQAKPKAAPKLEKAVAEALNAATGFASAGEYSNAQKEIDKAAAAAKTANDRYQIDTVRRFTYMRAKNYTKLGETLQSMVASGLMPAGEVKDSQRLIVQCYDQSGQSAKAVSSAREFVNKYGHDKDLTIFVASKALGAKDYKSAIEWANKAIDGERKAGRSAPSKWYEVALKAQFESKDLDGYYAGIERMAINFPKDDYWRVLASRAQKEAKYSSAAFELDGYRLLQAAGVTMKPAEKLTMAEAAFSRNMAAEALAILKPMKASGELDVDPTKSARNQRLLDTATKDAADDLAGITSQAAEAAKRPNGLALTNVAETYMAQGNNAKAIELFTAGITKGGMQPVETNAAKLRLGIAQMRAGQVDAARTTWGGITGDDGAKRLAQTWIVVSKKK
jgi:hypothetical protein